MAGKMKDITGERFGRLTALGPSTRRDSSGTVIWHCRCDCGSEVKVLGNSLRRGATQSCGCLFKERADANRFTHGMSGDAVYGTWRRMISRCAYENKPGYSNYGGRGITVCEEWQTDFVAFFEHVSQLPFYGEEGYSLDRIDNDKGYEVGNVKWSTKAQQGRNRRTNVMLTYEGKTQCQLDWAAELGMKNSTLRGRLQRGWSVEKALTTPVQLRTVK